MLHVLMMNYPVVILDHFQHDLPANGITYPGENMTGLVGQIIPFSMKPNSEGSITFTYDFSVKATYAGHSATTSFQYVYSEAYG